MSNNTKLILLGLVICVILGLILQNVIANSLMQAMGGGQQELLTPDQAAKKAQIEAIKKQKSHEAKTSGK